MSNTNTEQLVEYLLGLVEKGGPHASEYDTLTRCYQQFHELLGTGQMSKDELHAIWQRLGEPFVGTKTNQGHALSKPHGYAGDFEIIDRIYTHWVSPDERLQRWDQFFHAQSAAIAVRNRKGFFIRKLASTLDTPTGTIEVLNVASGPARDLAEFYAQHPNDRMAVDCVEYDANAIPFARDLTAEWGEQIHFIHANALKFNTDKRYDLIWSAGLFDYLDDPTFRSLLLRLYNMLKPNGELVVGNMSPRNPTQAYMSFVEWDLYHRSEADLRTLAVNSGIEETQVSITSEEERINLFLCVAR